MEISCDHDHDHHDHHHHGEEAEDALDPHIWLNVENACRMAENIRDEFRRADPAHAEVYRKNCAALLEELGECEKRLKTEMAPYRGRRFYVYHPAFGYFANMFGLRQEAVELDGREVTPAHLAELTRRAKSDRVGVIFVQPQFNPSAMRALQRQLRVEVKTADPLRRDVLKNIQELVSELRMAFAEYDSK